MPPSPGLESGTEVLTGEWIDPRLTEVEALARWMDYQFEAPGGFRFGWQGRSLSWVPSSIPFSKRIAAIISYLEATSLSLPASAPAIGFSWQSRWS
jgi:hypothetical protein